MRTDARPCFLLARLYLGPRDESKAREFGTTDRRELKIRVSAVRFRPWPCKQDNAWHGLGRQRRAASGVPAARVAANVRPGIVRAQAISIIGPATSEAPGRCASRGTRPLAGILGRRYIGGEIGCVPGGDRPVSTGLSRPRRAVRARHLDPLGARRTAWDRLRAFAALASRSQPKLRRKCVLGAQAAPFPHARRRASAVG